MSTIKRVCAHFRFPVYPEDDVCGGDGLKTESRTRNLSKGIVLFIIRMKERI